MRTFLLFLVAGSILLGQVGLFPTHELATYLKLSPEQVAQLTRNVEQFFDSQTSIYERVNNVNDEIRLETQKSTPDAMQLGIRYREIETICRDAEGPRRALHDKQISLLTAEQRTVVKKLQDSQPLRLLSLAAQSLFFLQTQPAFQVPGDPHIQAFNGTRYRGLTPHYELPGLTRNFDVTRELAAYLRLASAQLETIRTSLKSYEAFFTAQNTQMEDFARQLDSDLGTAALSAGDIGSRYLEIERARRRIAERESALRREIDLVMTAGQRTLLADLDHPEDFFYLAFWAEQLMLLSPDPAGGQPASRVSPLNVSIVTEFSESSSSEFLLSNSAAASIYRACPSGPNYTYRVDLRPVTKATGR